MARLLCALTASLIATQLPAVATADDAAAAGAPPASPAAAVAGTIRGRVLDGSTQEGIAAATVQVLGGPSVVAELDGTYALSLPPGAYTLVITVPEYAAERRTIQVIAARQAVADIALSPVPRAVAAETIEVHGEIDTRKDSAVLAERRGAATVSDAISAQQIARAPDASAADAARRVVAATIQDNRYLVVRGLGGRYSTTLLNGVLLPSPDPDVPAAPLDLFPASLITHLTINKTFTPDMPGSFAGGALAIETRSYPTRFLFKARVGIAGNTRSSFRTLNGQHGGSLDALGFDDGTRGLPGTVPDNQLAGDSRLSTREAAAQAGAFRNDWTIQRGMAGPNLSFGATLGDSLTAAGQRIGYFASASFGHSYTSRRIHLARVGEADGQGGRIPSLLQLDDHQDLEQASLGALGAVGWTPARGHRLDLFALYAHTGDASSSEVTGTEASTAVVDRTRLQFLQRELMFTQLVAEHRLSDAAVLEWQGNVARVAQHEPDTRDLLRTQTTDGRWAISSSAGSAERLFGELVDTTLGGAAAVRIPLATSRFKLGTSVQYSARRYQTRRFRFTLSGDAPFQSPDEAFAPSSVASGATALLPEATVPSDGYTATRTISGSYAMADVDAAPGLRLVGGLRVELAHLSFGQDSKLDLMAPPMQRIVRDTVAPLPSASAIWSLTPSTNLRAAYAMTVARPNFRELAPALYYDYVRRRAIGGNSELRETRIHNADLRWETFLGDSEVVAASAFAKHFVRPIERTVSSGGDGDNVGFDNAPSADSYGVELEARLSLRRIAPALAAFSVAGNLSLIGSRIDVPGGGTRALQGQSPYVANLALGYEHPTHGTRVDLAYNSFGRRIEEVGTAGAGDVYEQPFHRLDLTISQPLPRALRLKLAAANLLDQRVVRTQNDVEIFAYKVGVTVLGSVEYSLE